MSLLTIFSILSLWAKSICLNKSQLDFTKWIRWCTWRELTVTPFTQNLQEMSLLVCKLSWIKSVTNILAIFLSFYCRRWATYHWRCWTKCFCGHSWWYMRVTLRAMMTAIHTSLASPEVLGDERLLCCRQCAGNGFRHSLACQNHLLVIGWRNTLSVSSHTFIVTPRQHTRVVPISKRFYSASA